MNYLQNTLKMSNLLGRLKDFKESCCGINGPEDWYYAQVKTGGANQMQMGMGMEMSYMGIGSPSTGKCHLTPPTIPMGCGKKLLEVIRYTMAIYCGLLILETVFALSTAAFGWYCFFYWIEKEVIIIPEDEVSNLIVIEPESSTTTLNSSTRSGSVYGSWSALQSSRGDSHTYLRPAASHSRYLSFYQSQATRTRTNLDSRYSYDNSLSRNSRSRSFYPNSTRRHVDPSYNDTQFSNYLGAVPSIGGPHVQYHYPEERSYVDKGSALSVTYSQSQYQNHHSRHHHHHTPAQSEILTGTYFGGSLHHGQYGRSVLPHHEGSHYIGGSHQHKSKYLGGSISKYLPPVHHEHKPKKEHSFNHMLHKQEKALGGKVLAEMHVDHSRDPDPLNDKTDTAKGKKGHRAHHATIAIIKNKKAPKPKQFFGGPKKRHGQTGKLAEDILDMSGGAPAAKSMIDNINLPVEHDPNLTHQGYANKLHRAHRKKSQLDHPDANHPGHGPVHQLKNGILSAPSIDGSQAQSLMDNVFHPKPKTPQSDHVIKPHDVAPHTKHHHNPANNTAEHEHLGHHQGQSHHHYHNQIHSGGNIERGSINSNVSHHHSHHHHHDHHNDTDDHHLHHHNGSLKTQVLYKNPHSLD